MTESARQPLAPFSRRDRMIPVFLFHLIKEILIERGLPAGRLLDGTGLVVEQLADQERLVSFDQSMLIIENALAISGDAAFGLVVGGRERLSDLGMLGYALASCATMGDSLRISRSYYQTSTNLTFMEFSSGNGRLTNSALPAHPVPDNLYRFLVEEQLACFTNLMRFWKLPDLKPIEVRFCYPQPECVADYAAFFKCPLVFDAKENMVIFPEVDPNLRNPLANQVTENLAVKLCDDMLDLQDSCRGMINKIQIILLRNPGGFPSAQKVAEELDVSERKMRRMLSELNTSFQDIFDDVRKEIAISYLSTSNLAQEDIAQILGFSEASSFYRAFKKWTGKAPTLYRK